MTALARIEKHLIDIYGRQKSGILYERIIEILDIYKRKIPENIQKPGLGPGFYENDVILITYGDHFQAAGERPLQTLHKFLVEHLKNEISGVHILPFFPYSSDDGFSIIDYRNVDPLLEEWEDIKRISNDFDVMFDAVINHTSCQSVWFKSFTRGITPYDEYYIVADPSVDLSMVVRPRALPLLTPVETSSGTTYVWTTFSNDQIDLNYSSGHVLLEIIDLLLYYVSQGARMIRLDAIAYLWKEIGTTCIHLPQTHSMVKLFRAILDEISPRVIIVTETNVPHDENISYFGDFLPETGRTDEAQLVYQFPLAPLILHSLREGNVISLAEWAMTLDSTSLFFNFTASHDGIGVMPARGLLTDDEIQALVEQTISHGGQVSYKANSDGTRSVYELNITLYDALNDPKTADINVGVNRFLASQAIMLALLGVPGIYVHSLFGSRNCYSCVDDTARARSINREKLRYLDILDELENSDSQASRVFNGYKQLLKVRKSIPAFHPLGDQQIIILNPSVFSIIRVSPDRDDRVICLTNVTNRRQIICLSKTDIDWLNYKFWIDMINEIKFEVRGSRLELFLDAYQTIWIKPEVEH
jgi:sucrose phosphorylase